MVELATVAGYYTLQDLVNTSVAGCDHLYNLLVFVTTVHGRAQCAKYWSPEQAQNAPY